MQKVKVRVWDLPTRIFHWTWVSAFITAMVTMGDSRWLHIHVMAGYVVAGGLLFRIVWGLAGSRYARFREFWYPWRVVRQHFQSVLSGKAQHFTGHNPSGSWAIYLMLFLGLLVSVSGLVVLGGEEQKGPLQGLLSFSSGVELHEVHEFLAWFWVAVVVVHVSGVIMESRLLRENLVVAMVTGHKPAHVSGVSAHYVTGTVLLAVVAGFVFWWTAGYRTATAEEPFLPYTGPQLAQNEQWDSECGDCHLAYHPSLLPVRSWKKMLENDGDHFGEDLFLDDATRVQLFAFAKANSAEKEQTETAWYMANRIPSNDTPMRISETAYWKHQHEEVDDQTWRMKKVGSKANCDACHLDAKRGTFQDGAMRIPDSSKTSEEKE